MDINTFNSLKWIGKIIVFVTILAVLLPLIFLLFNLSEISELDWKIFSGVIILCGLLVLLIIPKISEINFFQIFKIKRSIDDISKKLDIVIIKSEAKAKSEAKIEFNFNKYNMEVSDPNSSTITNHNN